MAPAWRCLARESCAAVLGWVQTWATPGARLVAWTQTANHRSRRLLQALDMTETERFVKYGLPQVRCAALLTTVITAGLRPPPSGADRRGPNG